MKSKNFEKIAKFVTISIQNSPVSAQGKRAAVPCRLFPLFPWARAAYFFAARGIVTKKVMTPCSYRLVIRPRHRVTMALAVERPMP